MIQSVQSNEDGALDPYASLRATVTPVVHAYAVLVKQRSRSQVLDNHVSELVAKADQLIRDIALDFVTFGTWPQTDPQPLDGHPRETVADSFAVAQRSWVEFQHAVENLAHGWLTQQDFEAARSLARVLDEIGERDHAVALHDAIRQAEIAPFEEELARVQVTDTMNSDEIRSALETRRSCLLAFPDHFSHTIHYLDEFNTPVYRILDKITPVMALRIWTEFMQRSIDDFSAKGKASQRLKIVEDLIRFVDKHLQSED